MGKFFLIAGFLLCGCAERVVTVYQNVYIPQRCQVEKRARPALQTSPALTNILIIEYAELLEKDVEFCRGEK